jgi:hypothetical protein
MNRQEKHQQAKDHERAEQNRADKAYEEAQHKRRLPVNALWLLIIGFALVTIVVCAWTFGVIRFF